MVKTCYCCNEVSTGKDHVPPRCLFPKNSELPKILTTVPSCAHHNNHQSDDDEYLKFVLSSKAQNTPDDVIGSTARSIIRHMKRKSRSIKKYGIETAPSDESTFVLDNEYDLDIKKLLKSLEKIARGIYYFHHNEEKKLLQKLDVTPIFLKINPQSPAEVQERLLRIRDFTFSDLKEIPTEGNHKDIFQYQIIEDANIIVINMVFYQDQVVSVMCQP